MNRSLLYLEASILTFCLLIISLASGTTGGAEEFALEFDREDVEDLFALTELKTTGDTE